ncbi:MAG TPA: redox-regulated ATPase YchF [Syntrophomonadaceae bacterium]|nr:redox-regulated ATPase YchF [Syntrophomonadaceae bacterium]
MQLGIIGLPMVGKTTIFELLTESHHKGGTSSKANTAMARIPDYRIDYLSELYKPKKTTYAQLEIVDIPGLAPGNNKGASVFLDGVRQADALLHVVRVFEDDLVPMVNDKIDPISDIELINYELLLADLDLIDKRVERINAGKRKSHTEKELHLLSRLREAIENQQPISTVDLDDEEQVIMKSYQFLTSKPMLICLNLSEKDLLSGNYPDRDKVEEYCRQYQIPMVELSASIERDIAELDEEERELFMQDAGITEPGLVKVSRTMYERLGLISFFTVGEDEVKAWTINEGTNARKAAGKIHSDIERGFIRAEVVEFEALKEYGSMAAVKEHGLFRLEGKDYIVQDGDIVHFRFNI